MFACRNWNRPPLLVSSLTSTCLEDFTFVEGTVSSLSSDFNILIMTSSNEKLANIENFADAFVRPLHLPFPIFLSYIAAFSEIGGSWLLIIGLATRFGALAIVGTISVAIYHALVTSGFKIFLLELLLLYFASATSIALTGPGNFSLDEVIIRILKSEDEEETISSKKVKSSKQIEVKEETNKGGLFQFLQANILSDTSS